MEHTIDVCPNGHGMWVDYGELPSLIRHIHDSTEVQEASIKIDQPVIPPIHSTLHAQTDSPPVCPKCLIPLKVINYAYDSNIHILQCSHCQGVWLKKGQELQIARHLKGNPHLQRLGEELAKDVYKHRDLQKQKARYSPATLLLLRFTLIPIPLSDIRANIVPILTLSLIAFNTLIFIATHLISDQTESILAVFGLTPAIIMQGQQTFTIFTSMFLHANMLHLLSNMYFLWLFGDNVEERLGRSAFVLTYAISGLACTAGILLVGFNNNIPHVGASGAIAGLMGVYLVLFPDSEIKTLFLGKMQYISARLYLGIWIAIQVIYGFAGAEGIAWSGHLAGALAGILVGLLYKWFNSDKA